MVPNFVDVNWEVLPRLSYRYLQYKPRKRFSITTTYPIYFYPVHWFYMSASNIKTNSKSLTGPKSPMAVSSVQKFCSPRARSNRISLFSDLLPISYPIGGAVGAAPEFGKFWKLSPVA